MRRQPGSYSRLPQLSWLILLLASLAWTPAFAGPERERARAGEVDLWVTLAGNRPAVPPGETLLLTVRYGNQGSALAASTAVTVSLPSGFGLVEAYPAPIMLPNGTLGWQMGSLEPQSETFTILVVAQVTPAATINQRALITSGIAGPGPDAQPADNFAGFPLQISYWYCFPFFGNRFLAAPSF